MKKIICALLTLCMLVSLAIPMQTSAADKNAEITSGTLAGYEIKLDFSVAPQFDFESAQDIDRKLLEQTFGKLAEAVEKQKKFKCVYYGSLKNGVPDGEGELIVPVMDETLRIASVYYVYDGMTGQEIQEAAKWAQYFVVDKDTTKKQLEDIFGTTAGGTVMSVSSRPVKYCFNIKGSFKDGKPDGYCKILLYDILTKTKYKADADMGIDLDNDGFGYIYVGPIDGYSWMDEINPYYECYYKNGKLYAYNTNIWIHNLDGCVKFTDGYTVDFTRKDAAGNSRQVSVAQDALTALGVPLGYCYDDYGVYMGDYKYEFKMEYADAVKTIEKNLTLKSSKIKKKAVAVKGAPLTGKINVIKGAKLTEVAKIPAGTIHGGTYYGHVSNELSQIIFKQDGRTYTLIGRYDKNLNAKSVGKKYTIYFTPIENIDEDNGSASYKATVGFFYIAKKK